MADIRIKDLTTTASSTASDDFIAVDGTTNGTRKLSAFSPTFGGNVVVTGTLTAASNFSIASTGFYAGGGTPGAGRFLYSATAGSMLCGQGGSTYDLSLASSTGTTILGVPTGTNNVLIPATTASTTTSTGALVVGNGTSGGLGVGGSINCGGDITLATNTKAFYNLNYANAKGLTAGYFSRGTSGGWGAGLHFYSSNTDYSATFAHDPSTGDFHLYTTSSASNYTSSEIALTATAAKQIKVLSSTASTSTSSGALVVSGGVGVAGKLYAGDNIQVTNSFAGNNGFSVVNTNTGGLPGLYLEGDGGEYALIRRNNSTAGNPRRVEYIATGSGANHYFNTNTIIAGTITTNAPAGGTAAAWKLGTVATVSPTSPNRTIEVDIGGTIYYIHAKTTNN